MEVFPYVMKSPSLGRAEKPQMLILQMNLGHLHIPVCWVQLPWDPIALELGDLINLWKSLLKITDSNHKVLVWKIHKTTTERGFWWNLVLPFAFHLCLSHPFVESFPLLHSPPAWQVRLDVGQSIQFLMYISKNSSQLTLGELDVLLSITMGRDVKCNPSMGTEGKSLSPSHASKSYWDPLPAFKITFKMQCLYQEMFWFVIHFFPGVAGHYYCCFNSIMLNSSFMSMRTDRVIDLSVSKLNLIKDATRQLAVGWGNGLHNHPKPGSLIFLLIWPKFEYSGFLQEQLKELCNLKIW